MLSTIKPTFGVIVRTLGGGLPIFNSVYKQITSTDPGKKPREQLEGLLGVSLPDLMEKPLGITLREERLPFPINVTPSSTGTFLDLQKLGGFSLGNISLGPTLEPTEIVLYEHVPGLDKKAITQFLQEKGLAFVLQPHPIPKTPGHRVD